MMTEVSFCMKYLFMNHENKCLIYSNILTFPTVIPVAQINDEQISILAPRQWCSFLMLKMIVDLNAL